MGLEQAPANDANGIATTIYRELGLKKTQKINKEQFLNA
jgi:hypothetical protein